MLMPGPRRMTSTASLGKGWRDALLSMDAQKIKDAAAALGYPLPHPDDVEFWMVVHKSRSMDRAMPEEARRISMAWLAERGLRHLAEDLDPVGGRRI
jgi:hypothetical protein